MAGKGPRAQRPELRACLRPEGLLPIHVQPAAERAGMKGLKFHELRHTFATLALESDALDMHELSRPMGHASYACTDRVYAHLRPRDYCRRRAAFSAHVAAVQSPHAPARAIGSAS
ncbi:tyrosine-type recombinase/integrase [Microbacterium sp. NPDC055683]